MAEQEGSVRLVGSGASTARARGPGSVRSQGLAGGSRQGRRAQCPTLERLHTRAPGAAGTRCAPRPPPAHLLCGRQAAPHEVDELAEGGIHGPREHAAHNRLGAAPIRVLASHLRRQQSALVVMGGDGALRGASEGLGEGPAPS